MFCEKCGGELPEGAVFCPKCGNEVNKNTTEKKQEESNSLWIERINFDIPHVSTMKEPKKSKRPVFVVIGLLVVLVIVVETLLVPVFRQRDAKKVVEEAFQKTVQTLKEETKEREGVYQSFLESIPKKLKEDRIFWDWLEEITSKEMVEELLDSICENMEQYEIPKDAEEIILSYVSIDKEGRMVQLEVPFENDSEGEFVTSFLGRERLSDFISFSIHADDGYSKQQMEFLYQAKGQP